MKKILVCIFLLVFIKGFNQNTTAKKLSALAVLKLSEKYQKKATWFQEIPQYNRDSSIYYFEKESNLLKANSPIQNEKLASIYLQKSNLLSCFYKLTGIDSLATIGWSYFDKIAINKETQLLKYNFLINWATIKLELGEHKKSLELFSKALAVAEDIKSPDFVAKNLMPKGIFYERYQLEEEQKLSFENLSISLSYYQKFGEAKKTIRTLFSL